MKHYIFLFLALCPSIYSYGKTITSNPQNILSNIELAHDSICEFSDSIVSLDKFGEDHYTHKICEKYDSQKRLVSINSYNWEAGHWIPDYKDEFKYDSFGKISLQASYDCIDGIWQGKEKHEYGYDSLGNKTIETYYWWEHETWKCISKDEYSYAPNDTILVHRVSTNYKWRSDTWEKHEFSYDSNGNETSIISYKKINGTWTGEHKLEISYDSKGNEASCCIYTWTDNGWIRDYKDEYEYDVDGYWLSTTKYKWNGTAWTILEQ